MVSQDTVYTAQDVPPKSTVLDDLTSQVYAAPGAGGHQFARREGCRCDLTPISPHLAIWQINQIKLERSFFLRNLRMDLDGLAFGRCWPPVCQILSWS